MDEHAAVCPQNDNVSRLLLYCHLQFQPSGPPPPGRPQLLRDPAPRTIKHIQRICVIDHILPLPVPHRDILRVGVTLAGHQKKILNSVQMMRAQMNQIQSVEV